MSFKAKQDVIVSLIIGNHWVDLNKLEFTLLIFV